MSSGDVVTFGLVVAADAEAEPSKLSNLAAFVVNVDNSGGCGADAGGC